MENDSSPHLSPNLHLNVQIKMPKGESRSEMGLLNTLQIEMWQRYISWERSNPLRVEDPALVTKRVMFAYEQVRFGEKSGLTV